MRKRHEAEERTRSAIDSQCGVVRWLSSEDDSRTGKKVKMNKTERWDEKDTSPHRERGLAALRDDRRLKGRRGLHDDS